MRSPSPGLTWKLTTAGSSGAINESLSDYTVSRDQRSVYAEEDFFLFFRSALVPRKPTHMDPDSRRIVARHLLGLDRDGKTRSFRVLINGPIDEEIEKTGGWIAVDLRVRRYPVVQWWTRGAVDLHVFAHRLLRPHEHLHRGLVLHHEDEDKMNNSIENLRLVQKKIHDKYHRELRRVRKYGHRRREHEDGFYRHRPPKTITVSAPIEKLRARYDREGAKTEEALSALKKSKTIGKTQGEIIRNLVKKAEKDLVLLLAGLRVELPWLFKGDGRLDVNETLDPRWDTGRTWKLQIKKPRVRLTGAEMTLVLLYMKNGRDLDAVAVATGVLREVLDRIFGSDAVAHALDQLARRGNWRMPRLPPSHP